MRGRGRWLSILGLLMVLLMFGVLLVSAVGCTLSAEKVEEVGPFFEMCMACQDAIKETAKDPDNIIFPLCDETMFSDANFAWSLGNKDEVFSTEYDDQVFLKTLDGNFVSYHCTVWYEDDTWRGTAKAATEE